MLILVKSLARLISTKFPMHCHVSPLITYIPLARIGARVGSVGARVGSGGLRVGSARVFRYQHVGTGNAKSSQGCNASDFALHLNICFIFHCNAKPLALVRYQG